MICYVLAMGKQHQGPHVVVGYGIKIFWPGLFITSLDHLDGEPRLTFQQMYRLICGSLLNRHSTNTLVGYVPRVYTGWTSTDVSQYIDCDVNGNVSADAYRSNTGQLPAVVYWSTVGPVSVAS